MVIDHERGAAPDVDVGDHGSEPGGGPNRFGPSVPRKQPSSTITQMIPMIGITEMMNHFADLSRSWRRLMTVAI